MCCDTVNRGLAYADGKIFLHQADTTLVALDAKTGKLSLVGEERRCRQGPDSAPTRRSSSRTRSWSAFPAANSACAAGSRAYNIKDGKLAWRGYSDGPGLRHADRSRSRPPRSASRSARILDLSTWQGDQWKIGGGATWGWYSYDPDLNLVYYGSGNPSTWNPMQRPGDNSWSMSIWARDLDTGAVKWIYQMTPHDEWDYDGVNEMILTDQTDRRHSRASR